MIRSQRDMTLGVFEKRELNVKKQAILMKCNLFLVKLCKQKMYTCHENDKLGSIHVNVFTHFFRNQPREDVDDRMTLSCGCIDSSLSIYVVYYPCDIEALISANDSP